MDQSRLKYLLSISNMRNNVLDELDVNELSAFRAATNNADADNELFPKDVVINYDWREETDKERELRLEQMFDMGPPQLVPPPLSMLQLRAAPSVNKRVITFYIILDKETCKITRILSKYDLEDDVTGELRQQLAIKANNQPITTWDIYDENVENIPSFRIIKDGETINMQRYNGNFAYLGTLVYENGPLAGKKVLFDEKGRVISHPIRNSHARTNEGRKSRKLNRPKSKKSCKKVIKSL